MTSLETASSLAAILPARLLAQASSTEVEESLRWLRMPPPWVVVLVVVPLVVLFVAWFYRREVPIGGSGWRWGLGALRTALILFVLAMLAQPVLRRTTYETRESSIVCLVDDSLSMDIADRYSRREIPGRIAEMLESDAQTVESTTRYDLVRRALSDPGLDLVGALREKGKVVLSTFARSVREHTELASARGQEEEESAGDAEPPLPLYSEVRDDSRVGETRIVESLRDAVWGVLGSGFGDEGERVSGVLLISDGQENAGSLSAEKVARDLGERGIPVQAVGIGNPDEPRDIRLVNVDVQEVVLVDDEVPVDATVIADGFEGERVPVRLRIDSGTEDTRYVTLQGEGQRQSVRLDWRPRRPGKYTLTTEVEKLGGEVFYDNNTVSKSIRVIDEKIRVLYLESLPRWEYRYLKNAVIRDPTMEAQAWLYSADADFVQESSPSVPPLDAPPSTREEVFRYHVVILGDVGADDLGGELAALLKEFVYEGGGLIFIAGRHANPWKLPHTDLSPVLPVEVPESDPFRTSPHDPVVESFKVRLTPEGRELPIMRLDNDPERNQSLWEDEREAFYDGLPPFYWYAEVGQEKASTVVLARHPRDQVAIARKGRPVFAYMNYGRGRSFFSAVDNTWRWRAGVDNKWFYRFWGQVVRFAATGRLLGKTPQFSVTTDKVVYDIGETVKIDARIFDAGMKPLTEPTYTLYHQVQGREGEPPERIELALNEVKGPGSYEGAMSASSRGRHDIWLGTETERLAFRSFAVEIPALETRDPRLDRDLLRRIALASGGEYHEFYELPEAVERLQGVSRSQQGLEETDDLWDDSWVILLFTALICAEWILRKFVRLL